MSRAPATGALAALLAAGVGCSRSSPPEQTHAAQSPATADLAMPPAAARPPMPTPSAVQTAEVEISGKVARGKARGDVTVWVTDGPCWQAATRAWGSTHANADAFFVEVIVPQGSPLWVCAGAGDGKRPLTVYGGIEQPLLGKGIGEVTYNITVPLHAGKPVAAPGPHVAAPGPPVAAPGPPVAAPPK